MSLHYFLSFLGFCCSILTSFFFFFLNDTPPPESYPLSLHDALPISWLARVRIDRPRAPPRSESHDLAVRAVLSAAAAGCDVGGRPPLHPLLRQEHGEAAPAVPEIGRAHV